MKRKTELEQDAIEQQKVSVKALKDEKRQSLAVMQWRIQKSKEDLILKKDNLAHKLLDL